MPTEKSSSRSSKNAAVDRKPAQQQLDSFLSKYTSEIAVFARRALVKMRRVVPGAVKIVYDNYNALAIGFGPSERASEAIFSVVLYPKNVTLFFLQEAKLPDPDKRLRGSGNVVRHIRLNEAGKPDAKVLDDPEVQRLMEEALRRAKVPMPSGGRRRLVIKSVLAKQRPRQPKS